MTEPSVEILLVQRDQRQVELTLGVVQSNRLANRILVVRDGAEALEFLFRMGPYAGRPPADPSLVLFHLRLADPADIEILRRIKRDPRTSAIPVTVLAVSSDDRLAAMSELREYDLRLPVVVIADPVPPDTARAFSSIGGKVAQAGAQPEDLVSVVRSADDAERLAGAKTLAGAPASVDDLCLERDLETLMRMTRGAAHEFNNLFSVMIAYTEMLLKDIDLDDPRRTGADDLFRAISRASKLTRQLLTFSPASAQAPLGGPSPTRPGPRPIRRPTRMDVA